MDGQTKGEKEGESPGRQIMNICSFQVKGAHLHIKESIYGSHMSHPYG